MFLENKQLNKLNDLLEPMSVQEVLDWVFAKFTKIGMLTSAQESGSVLARLLFKQGIKVDLLFVDTGVHFQESLDTVNKLASTCQFNLKIFSPALSMSEQIKKYGVLYLDHAGQERCCHMRKVEPILNLNQDYHVLLGALRRTEGGRRKKVPIVSIDPNLKLLRINPMANMSQEDFTATVNEKETLINPLHNQGYPTIGCNRCTTPVIEDEPQRAGRWRHLDGAEYCGINPTDFIKKAEPTELSDDIHLLIKEFI